MLEEIKLKFSAFLHDKASLSAKRMASGLEGVSKSVADSFKAIMDAGAKMGGKVGEAFSFIGGAVGGFAERGLIGGAANAVGMLIGKWAEAAEAAKRAQEAFDSAFAAGNARLAEIGRKVRANAFRSEMEAAAKAAERMAKAFARAQRDAAAMRGRERAAAESGFAARYADLETRRLAAHTGDAAADDLSDKDFAVEKARLDEERAVRMAEFDAKEAEARDKEARDRHQFALDQEESLRGQIAALRKREKAEAKSVADHEMFRAQIKAYENKIAESEESRKDTMLEIEEAEFRAAEAQKKLAVARETAAANAESAEQSRRSAREGAWDDAKRAAGLAADEQAAEARRRAVEGMRAGADAARQRLAELNSARPGDVKGVRESVADYMSAAEAARQEAKDEARYSRRLRTLEAKQARMSGRLGGKMTRKDVEEMEAIRKHFADKGKKAKWETDVAEATKALKRVEEELKKALTAN